MLPLVFQQAVPAGTGSSPCDHSQAAYDFMARDFTTDVTEVVGPLLLRSCL
jgi:hypothetical protein